MSFGAVSDDRWAREFPLERASEKEVFSSEAAASGLLLVEVGVPRPPLRGRLSLFIEGAIERALDARGAPPPSVPGSAGRDAGLDDFVRRAHVSGATGLALWVSSLEALTVSGAFDSDDSATLSWWLDVTTRRPVRVALAPANHALKVYLPPVTLASILADAASESDDSVDSTEDRETVAASESTRDVFAEAAAGRSSEVAAVTRTPESDAPSGDEVATEGHRDASREEPAHDETPPESTFAESARQMAAALSDGDDTVWLRDALLEMSTPPPARTTLRADAEEETFDSDGADESVPPPPIAPALNLRFADSEPPPPAPAAPPPFELDAEQRRQMVAHGRELRAASGPKPLGVVERLFSTAYVPLRTALDRGADLPNEREIADEWSKGFGKSYEDAFDALRMRSKRPPMVVDVPEISLRVARLHGARATQLLLVDGLRYDLGDRVNERLRVLAGQRAACAERFLLWSALPTTTAAQLELIGRGASGLREFTGDVSSDLVVARGRKASMIRRLKTGHREVLKLDVVESKLMDPNGADPAGFDELADEVAQRIAAHFEGLQPRTLVMVFGDHGFRLEHEGEGPHVAKSGGSSPEEVLVPAFAWLVGAVH